MIIGDPGEFNPGIFPIDFFITFASEIYIHRRNWMQKN